MDREDTDPGIHGAIEGAAADLAKANGGRAMSAHEVAKALVELGTNGHADDMGRVIKSGRWNSVIVAILVGAGSVTGGWYALKAAVDRHETQIEAHRAAPAHKAAASKIGGLETRVEAVENDIGSIKSDQKVIKSGIEELKKENVNDLKSDLDDARREIRRIRRNGR